MAIPMDMGGADVAGFYGVKFDRAANYPHHFLARPGGPDDPVLVARRRMDAPYPDVELVIPVSPHSVTAYLNGDRSVVTALAAELVVVYGHFLRDHGITTG